MIGFIQSIVAFIFALGILITFHEFGHYWVARRCNVKILRFSVGFGKPIWRFDFKQPFWHLGFTHNPWKIRSLGKLLKQREFDKDETEFVLAALPLGGYVKMLDEREGSVPEDEMIYTFNRKPLAQRLAIVLAGPVFNFIFAVFAYCLVYMIGISGLKPVIEEIEEGSIAMEAGFMAGQEIIAVDGDSTHTWNSVIERTVPKVVEGKRISFEIVNSNNSTDNIEVDLSRISIDEMASGMLLTQLGIIPRVPVFPAVLGEITPGGAAEQAGLQTGDLVTMANGIPINSWSDWVEIIRASPGETLEIQLVRDGLTIEMQVTPSSLSLDNGDVIGRIGAAFDTSYVPDENYYTRENYSVLPAVYKAMGRTIEMSVMTLQILGKMIVGEASVKNLSGPITIAKYAGDTANLGIVAFLGFLAIVSVSLGVLNLLPVPLLDGGHILFYLIEGIKGSPLSESFQVIGQQIGLVLLLSLMGLALYNDILRVIS
jgi:regulator of sigma E protease